MALRSPEVLAAPDAVDNAEFESGAVVPPAGFKLAAALTATVHIAMDASNNAMHFDIAGILAHETRGRIVNGHDDNKLTTTNRPVQVL